MRCNKFSYFQLLTVTFTSILISYFWIAYLVNKSSRGGKRITETTDKYKTKFDQWKKYAAYPWLFTDHPMMRRFSSIHNDLDQLLALMCDNLGRIALLRFSYPWQMMLQNQIYTIVKHGQVYNYIVMVADEKSLQVCFELNLPCFNGTKYYKNYYKDLDPTVEALFSNKKYYKPMNWFKLRFYFDVLRRNYTILAVDTDISFGRKDIWLSLEKYSLNVGGCDMIFMREAPVNAGFFYCKPNNKTFFLLKEWINTEYTHSRFDEQRTFGLMRGHYYEICNTKDECNKVKEKKIVPFSKNSLETMHAFMFPVRRFSSPYRPVGSMECPVKKLLDPCFGTSIYVHPLCVTGQTVKAKKIAESGFWMMQNPCDKVNIQVSLKNNESSILEVYRCKPAVFANPSKEIEFEKCTNLIAWAA